MENQIIQIGSFKVTAMAVQGGRTGNVALTVAEDGFLGNAGILPDKFFLRVEVNPKVLCTGVVMKDGKERGQKVMTESPFRLDRDFMIFERGVEMKYGEGGKSFRPNQNDIRFAMLGSDGVVEYYQAGLVVQENKIFLVIQQKGNGHFYRNSTNKLECTGVRDELRDLLIKVFGEKLGKWALPGNGGQDDYVPLPESREPKTGVVNWYDDVRQVGMLDVFVGQDDALKPVSVGWQACPERGANGRRYLTVGEVVRIEELGAKADTRSTIKEEAKKVVLLTAAGPTDPTITEPRSASAVTS